jgi:hypothetical protein
MHAPRVAVARPNVSSSANDRRVPVLPQVGDPAARQAAERPNGNFPQGWDFGKIAVLASDETSRGAQLPPVAPRPLVLQRQLSVGEVDDPLEHEADRIADHVMRMPDSAASTNAKLQRAWAACEEERLSNGAASSRLDRKPATSDDKKKLQQKPAATQVPVGEVPTIVHDILRSSGRPLDPTTRAYFEPRFGYDFGKVRIHADGKAAASARAVNANAYTVGQNIAFDAGRFAPGTKEGRRLLAHELTHVVQQAGGGAPPGPEQERDAEAACAAVEASNRPQVRAPSRLGLAAQPKPLASGGGLSETAEPEDLILGLNIVKVSEIKAKVTRIIKAPDFSISQGRADFNQSPAKAKANLYHGHFRNDDERLSYALGVFQQLLGIEGKGVDPDELFSVLVNYEVEAERQTADLVIHTPPTPVERYKLSELKQQRRAEIERREYEFYLAEVARLKAEAHPGPATVGLYESYIFAPAEEAFKGFVEEEALPIASLLLDFVPVAGQLKAIAEAIIGRDIITGRRLADWERGLNILLALVPEAKEIFSAGRAGLRTLAAVSVKSGRSADEIYRVTKAASKLSVEEVEAAEKVVADAPLTPAQSKVAESLAEMTGSPLAKPFEELAGELERIKQPTQLAGKKHTLSIRRVGKKLTVWLCSNGCGDLIAKAEAMMDRLPAKHPARGELKAFIKKVETEATWIDVVPTEAQAQEKLGELQKDLEAIQQRHRGTVDPDVQVTPAAPATTTEQAPVVEPAGPARAERVRPAELDPPGTEYKRPVPGQTGAEGATDIPSWVRDEGYAPPRAGERGEDYATRLMNHKYGEGNWKRGPGTEHNQIQKWADRHFQ